MQIILFQNIERLGMQGDVVNVASGYYRNYLSPRGIAVEATPGNLSRLDIKRKRLKAEAERQVNEAGTVAKQLAELQIRFVMKAHDDRLFGSVQDHDIVERIQAAGFKLDRRQVALHEPIKTLGTHHVRIKLVGHIEAQVTVVVEPEGGEEPVKPAKAAPATEAPAAPVAETPAADAPEVQA